MGLGHYLAAAEDVMTGLFVADNEGDRGVIE
jgi:hypothetical protein